MNKLSEDETGILAQVLEVSGLICDDPDKCYIENFDYALYLKKYVQNC